MNTRYELNMDVPPREAIRLMYVSKSRFGGDWNSVPHTHSCTEVFYCVNGRGQFNVEGKMLDVAPDDMVIVNPRTLHTELSYQACPLEYIVLGIEGVEILFNQRDQGYTMVKCGAMREDLLGLTKMLLREIDAREDGCEMVCQDLTEVLLVKLVRTASLSLRVSTPPAESKECAAAKRYIDENYSRTITLDSLAEIAHVNKYYLSHSFKREYGTSPHRLPDEAPHHRGKSPADQHRFQPDPDCRADRLPLAGLLLQVFPQGRGHQPQRIPQNRRPQSPAGQFVKARNLRPQTARESRLPFYHKSGKQRRPGVVVFRFCDQSYQNVTAFACQTIYSAPSERTLS